MPSYNLEVHVSPTGSASAKGTPTDPFDTVATALNAIRGWRLPGESAAIRLMAGKHHVDRPIELGPLDSRLAIIGDATGTSVIDGGVELVDWAECTTPENATIWAAPAPSTRAIHSFFAGDERRDRPRYPRDTLLQITDQAGLDLSRRMTENLFQGSTTFRMDPAKLRVWRDVDNLEAVIPHYWVQERMPVASVDVETGTIESSRRSIFALRDDVRQTFARFWFENVAEALGEVSGEWYHDRRAGLVLYSPRPDDDLATFTAVVPLVEQLVVVAGGDTDVLDIKFDNVTFSHTDWDHARRTAFGVDEELTDDVSYASAPQASTDVTATIEVSRTHGFELTNCTIEHAGGYAIEMIDGVTGAHLQHNTFHGLGAGGIAINGATELGRPGVTRDNVVIDNEISHGGLVFPAGIGVLIRHSRGNQVSHNHIHDFHYSGISCGWVWGYGDSISRDNRFEYNHIHDIGHGRLSDMGGIYLLGVQPGTVVRRNLIHGIHCANYGGWCIYLDEGSSHVLVEDNVCHDAATQAFHQHYGRENVVRNNIFAFGARGQIATGRVEPHLSYTMERNIMIGAGRPAYVGGTGASDPHNLNMCSDLNLVWDTTDTPAFAGIGRADAVEPDGPIKPIPDSEWRGMGHDRHSITADPGLELPLPVTAAVVVPKAADANELGIRPIDLSTVGPRSRRAQA